MRISRWLIIVLACIMVTVAGCNTQKSPGNHAAAGDKFDELRREGIQVLYSWEDGGVTHVGVVNADQRTVHRVRQVMGQKAVIWNEEESFFVRGVITEISPDSGTEHSGRIRVEGVQDQDSVTDKGVLSIGENTRILQTSQQGSLSGMGQRALVFRDLQQGQTVEAWIVGMVLDSYPPKAGASKIVILD